jgi:non-heme chloroperoxidase
MPYIEVGTENNKAIDLYFEDHGSGQPVVLIHGFPLDRSAWEKQEHMLLNAGYRTISYDRRGFGRSDKPISGYDYDTFVSDLDTLINALNLRNIVLIGHSMGTGEVVHYLGTRGSERVSKAVCIAPLQPYLLKTKDNPTGVERSVFEDFKASIVKDRFVYLTNFFKDFFNSDENLGKRASKESIRYAWNVASIASPTGTLYCVDAWLTDFRPDIAKIDIPMLIIHGDKDRILPIDATGRVFQKTLKGSEYVELNGAPHNTPWTHAEEVNRALLKFMR